MNGRALLKASRRFLRQRTLTVGGEFRLRMARETRSCEILFGRHSLNPPAAFAYSSLEIIIYRH